MTCVLIVTLPATNNQNISISKTIFCERQDIPRKRKQQSNYFERQGHMRGFVCPPIYIRRPPCVTTFILSQTLTHYFEQLFSAQQKFRLKFGFLGKINHLKFVDLTSKLTCYMSLPLDKKRKGTTMTAS